MEQCALEVGLWRHFVYHFWMLITNNLLWICLLTGGQVAILVDRHNCFLVFVLFHHITIEVVRLTEMATSSRHFVHNGWSFSNRYNFGDFT